MHRSNRVLSLLAVVLLLLVGCSESAVDSVEVASMVAPHRAMEHIQGEYQFLMHSEWLNAEESPAVIRDERMPDWAVGRYEHCLYWEGRLEFERYRAIRQTEYGTARAWMLATRQGELRFLELTFDVDDGLSYNFIDAWEETEEGS